MSLAGSKNKAPRCCGKHYTPYRRLIPYVDTTKMTDSQFYEAKMLGQIQTLTAISASRFVNLYTISQNNYLSLRFEYC